MTGSAFDGTTAEYLSARRLADGMKSAWEATVKTPVHAGDIGGVAKLKETDGGPILVAGSCTLVHTLLEHGLVDEYRLMVFPVLLGSGKRLFPASPEKRTLQLVDSREFPSGVVVRHYRPAA